MKAEFWHEKWRDNDIGFDQPEVNPLLAKHLGSLDLSPGSTVFVPLCGKSIDMVWLLKQGHKVVGVELSEDAIEQFFRALEIEPEISRIEEFTLYTANNIEIYIGDYFALNQGITGRIDAVYDRASLVALPLDMRVDYTRHLVDVTESVSQLLITFNYDQSLQSGPPFAISETEIRQHYIKHHEISQLDSVDVAGGLKGGCQADEQVWLLEKTSKSQVP